MAGINPTMRKYELFQSYKQGQITSKELTNKVYEIDNPPRSKFYKFVSWLLLIVLAPVLSSRKD